MENEKTIKNQGSMLDSEGIILRDNVRKKMKYQRLEIEAVMFERMDYMSYSGQPNNVPVNTSGIFYGDSEYYFTQGTCGYVTSNGGGRYNCSGFTFFLANDPNGGTKTETGIFSCSAF